MGDLEEEVQIGAEESSTDEPPERLIFSFFYDPAENETEFICDPHIFPEDRERLDMFAIVRGEPINVNGEDYVFEESKSVEKIRRIVYKHKEIPW